MYDSDELRALAVAAQAGSPIAQYRLTDALEPETVLELLDEIERLRKDQEPVRIPDEYVAIPQKMFFYLLAGDNKAYLLGYRFREIIKLSGKTDEGST